MNSATVHQVTQTELCTGESLAGGSTCSWMPPSTLEVASRPWLSTITAFPERPAVESTLPEDSLSSELASSETLDSALKLRGPPRSGRVRPRRFSSGRSVSLLPRTDLKQMQEPRLRRTS